MTLFPTAHGWATEPDSCASVDIYGALGFLLALLPRRVRWAAIGRKGNEERMIATAIIFISLGLDTLAVSLGLGLSGLPRNRWLRVGLTFALCEGLMPVVGLLIGQRLGTALGAVATYVAAGILIIIGGLEIKEAMMDDDDDPVIPTLPTEKKRPLLLTGLSVSLDELAVGFALGVLHVSLGPALAYIALQAFALTFVGLLIGQRLGKRLGERAELASGVVLALLGVAIVLSEITGSHFL